MNRKSLDIKYPWPVPTATVFVSLLLFTAMLRGPVHSATVIVAIGSLALTIYALAYRIRITTSEVHIRRGPFLNTSILLQDVTHLVRDRTLVLVTAKNRIPLWGLTLAGRETLFDILPSHIDVLPSATAALKGDPATALRAHKRWTFLTGIGFLVTAVLSVPFYRGYPLQEYWGRVGQYLTLLCLLFLIATVVGGAIYWGLWSTKREIERIGKHDPPDQE
jgi:hypothetical protein